MNDMHFKDNGTTAATATKPRSLKLRLDKEVIRTLSGSELAQVAGGFAHPCCPQTCDNTRTA
jgi:hypothetical protein